MNNTKEQNLKQEKSEIKDQMAEISIKELKALRIKEEILHYVGVQQQASTKINILNQELIRATEEAKEE